MKILKIKGKNLASLGGEFEIDFTTEPLASAGIFAITGNTGSGKSTILDAICLALYDCTPRMNKAKEANVQLKDVNDKSISQNDSRSILRRGSADCYAQVDFVASTGERYSASWSVRRAGNKPSGSLQKVEMSAINLDSGEPLQGTKSEIQARLVELVGLSFEQFSRSVLLAQGDFASFLKAKKDEKAEILEKLTGTEIYSEISKAIYNKAKEVETKRKELLQHIQDVDILSDEDIEKLQKEKQEKTVLLETVYKDEDKCRNSIKWIEDYNQLLFSIKQANDNLNSLNIEIEKASSRYKKIDIIDSAQSIRNIYIEQTIAKKQLEEGKIFLEKQNEYITIVQKKLQEALDDKNKLNEEEEQLNTYLNKIQPELELAKKLDVQLDEARKRAFDLQTESNKLEELLKTSKEQLNKESSKLEVIIKKNQELDDWFKRYQSYSSLVPAKDLVDNLLSNYYNSIGQIETISKNIVDINKNIETFESNFNLAKQEAERVNSLQPSEVLLLRKKLEQGKPCPVCGSTEHPITFEIHDTSLKEEEIEKQKERANKEIERISLMLENSRKELIRNTSSIENYENIKANSIEKAKCYISILPKWEEFLNNGTLKDVVAKFVTLWNNNNISFASNRELLSATQAGIEAAKREVNNLNSQFEDKKKSLRSANDNLIALDKQRSTLLEGKSCDEMQRLITEKKSDLDIRIKKSIDNENSLKIEVENAKTKLQQIESQIYRASEVIEVSQNKIFNWLSSQQKIISYDELGEIFSKDESWIASEKKYLSSLKERQSVAVALLKEREDKLVEHKKSPKRANEIDSVESLHENLTRLLQEKNNINIALAQIDVQFDNDKKSRKKVEAYRKEYEENSELFQSWSNLNDLFGSQSGNKFKEIAQEYTLDILVMYANNHLKELAPRYELERIEDTLALQIADLDMMGEKRTVHSLSGGESFLVSLALALGLSSISSNKMNVESLFIDEGFGSLDIDTLRIAMDALESLQMQGRKIGVISHVSEMTERINCRIQVIKEGSGKSVIKVE